MNYKPNRIDTVEGHHLLLVGPHRPFKSLAGIGSTALLSLFLISLLGSCRQLPENDLSKANLKGKIKQITEYYYSITGTEGAYIINGRILGESLLLEARDDDGMLSYMTVVKYNEQGFREEIVSNDSAVNGFSIRENFIYHKDGLLAKRESYDQGTLVYVDTFEYDKNRQEVNHWLYDHENTLLELVETQYSDKQIVSVTKGILEDEDGLHMMHVTTTLLNEAGLPSSIMRAGADEELVSKRVLKYNAKGLLVEEVFFDSENTQYQKSSSSYDDNGNETEFSLLDLEDNNYIVRYSYRYHYDKKDNWVDQVTLIDGEVRNLTVREIEYYE